MATIDTIKHLLPRAQAWVLTKTTKTLRQFFDAIAGVFDDLFSFFELMWLDMFPATTREITAWEAQFGLPTNTGLTEAERRARLAAVWSERGGQSPYYIQTSLQAAGFDVFVWDWWVTGTNPPESRNPFDILGLDSDDFDVGRMLVNKRYIATFTETTGCGEPLMQCGEPGAQCGENSGLQFARVEYPIPSEPSRWPYIMYITGDGFSVAEVPSARFGELEDMCLKLCPAHLWIGLLAASSVEFKAPVTGLPAVPVELLTDGDMEAAGTGAYTPDDATLSKSTSNPYAGAQSLAVVGTGVDNDPRAKQTVCDAGEEYRVRVRARANETSGSSKPTVYSGGSAIHTGAASADWQDIDVAFEAGAADVGFGGSHPSSEVGFDAASVMLASIRTVGITVTAGKTVSIDWGDGSTSDVVADGTLKTLTHGYVTLGTFTVSLVGDFDGVTRLDIPAAYSGSVAGFALLKNLETLDASGSTVLTNSVGMIRGLTQLTALDLSNTDVDYSTGGLLPAWSNAALTFDDCGWSSAEVDRFLIDLDAAGGVDGTLSFAGANGARTSASLAAYNGLIARGWSITANGVIESFKTDQTPLDDLVVKITVNTGELVKIFWGDGDSETVTADGTEKTLTHDYTAAGTGDYDVTIAGAVGEVTSLNIAGQPVFGDICGICNLTGLEVLLINNTAISGDIGGINTLTSMLVFYCYDSGVTGDIGGINTLTSLADLRVNNTSISGDIGGINTLASLNVLFAYNTSITGDIGGINALTALGLLFVYDTAISGDIGGIGTLTALQELIAHNTSIAGDVDGIDTLTSLQVLFAYNTNITGNVGGLSPLTALTLMYVQNTDVGYSPSTLPDWSGISIQAQDCAMTSTEVDDFLIGLDTSGSLNGTLNVAGTNAARTSASLAAYNGLIAKGWSITANGVIESFKTDQTPLDDLVVKITVNTGELVKIFWGDGNTDTVTADGTEKTLTHDYAAAGTGDYDVTIAGAVGEVTYLHIAGEPVFGDIVKLDNLVGIDTLRINSSGMTGDIDSLATLTAATALYVHGTAIAGNFGALSPITGLSNLTASTSSVGYSPSTLPDWSGITIIIVNCSLTSTEHDNILIDLSTSGATGGTLDITSGNAARTAASDAAYTDLTTTKGWTIT